MEIVHTLDIDGSQWELQDVEARNRIEEIVTETNKIIDTTIGGTFNFSAKMKYLGKDETYEYYNFWWEAQTRTIDIALRSIIVTPPNTTTDKILAISINPLQVGNSSITCATQHVAGENGSGIITYLMNTSAATQWTISGMGILRRKK